MQPRQKHGFSRALRLTAKREFDVVYSGRKRVRCDGFTFFVGAVRPGPSRLGFSVGRKAGNAVTRNRIRRLAREFFRQSDIILKAGVDVVFHAVTRQAEQADMRLGVGFHRLEEALVTKWHP